MKVNKNNLAAALETVKPGLANNEVIEQATSFCFLKGKVVTYNDEISISCPVEDLELKGAINANELYNFVNKVSAEEIDLEVSENEILLKAGRSKAGLKLQAEVVLPIEEIGEIKKWKKLPKGFLKAIQFAMGSCSRDMNKPNLTCVHIIKNVVEASDGFRVIHYTLDEKVPIDETLLPANSCAVVVKMKPVEITESDGWVHFKTKDEVILSCRIFDEKYVNTSNVLDISGDDLPFPEETIDILDRAGIFSKRDHILDESIVIKFSNRKLMIRSESESGWFEEKAKTSYKGKDISFNITPYLLKDILNETSVGIISPNKLAFKGKDWKYITILRN